MKHQFYTKDFFIPSWDIKYLFLGTFNPNEGEKVNYFYTRKTNLLWPILSKIFNQLLIKTPVFNFIQLGEMDLILKIGK
jgi:hypothetical protein